MRNRPTENLETRILKEINYKPLTIDELVDKLKIKTLEETKALSTILIKLQKENKIFSNRKYKYVIKDNRNEKHGEVKEGILEIKTREDGTQYGFVIIEGEEKDTFITSNNLNGALEGEKVKIEITGKGRKGPEGKVIEIIEKINLDDLVAEVIRNEEGKLVLNFDEGNFKSKEIINNSLNALPEQKVVVKIDRNNLEKFEIVEILGFKNEPGVDLMSIARPRKFTDKWSIEAMKELDEIPMSVTEKDIIDRIDLRDKLIFTIDGDDTKDIDDALSIERLENENILLGVHIADVTHYIKEGSCIYNESFARGTSVYMINTVLAMLHTKISNGICSLNPNVDRLTMTCEMEINKNGQVVNSKIYKSVINSKIQMTYDNVNKIVENNIIPVGYEKFVETLKLLNEIAKTVEKDKFEKGMIEFSSDERKFKLENFIPVEITKRVQKSGEKLIEQFMVLANETVAKSLCDYGLPLPYRVHDKPDVEAVKELIDIALEVGINITDKNRDYSATSKDFQDLMKIIREDEKLYKLLGTLAKRTQKKAIYTTKNIGHFGLASSSYCHFTSPIRRFPDQLVHKMTKFMIDKKIFNAKELADLAAELEKQCEHCSYMERQAVEAEREAEKMKMAEMATYHLKEEFNGVISGVVENGIYVELSNNLEGYLPVAELPKDMYKCVSKSSLVGDSHKYTIGDDIFVTIKDANKEKRTIDLSIKKMVEEVNLENENKVLVKNI